jgi:Zn-dependent protease
MLGKAFRLPIRLAGIPLYVDLSFLIVLPLMVWMTAGNLASYLHLTSPHPLSAVTPLMLGLIAVVGLFTSVILHELGHSLTARMYGVKVRRITLWFLGGVAEFEEMPRQRGAEAVVAIAGPIVSFVLAAVCWGLVAFIPPVYGAARLITWYVGALNLMLGLFNLLPALPLDGGRILRSLLALRMPHVRATIVSGNVAKVIAVLLGVYGLFSYSPWLIVMAFFIYSAVKAETRYSIVTDLLRGLSVSDLVIRDVDMNYLATVRLPVISERADALDAFRLLSQTGAPALLVTDDAGRIAGVITPAQLQRAIQSRTAGFQVATGAAAAPADPDAPATPVTVTRVPPHSSVGYTRDHAPGDSERYARPL